MVATRNVMDELAAAEGMGAQRLGAGMPPAARHRLDAGMQAKGRKRGMNTVENLAKQLVAAIREEARAELSETVRTALGVPPRSLQFERQDARRYAAKARAKKNGLATHGAGQKRDPAAIAKLTESLHETIKANPGQRMETHQAALGLKAKDVMLPIKKLIAAKRIRFQGDKRARRYWAK